MNIYIGWLLGIAIFGIFLMWGIYVREQKYKNEYYTSYSELIILASYFLPISGIVFAYPFTFSNENFEKYIEWSLVYRDFLRVCVFEVILLFCIFIPLFYKRVRLEKTEAALKDAFLKGAVKYGVTNNHYEPYHEYSVLVNKLHLEAPSYYMYYWHQKYTLDEVTLIENETKKCIEISEEHLWLQLAPFIDRPGHIIFPWTVKWDDGSFPRKEFVKWCAVRGYKNFHY